MLQLIDRLASRWLGYRTEEAVKKMQAGGEGVEIHKVSIENGELEMLMLAPGVFELASGCAALLNLKNAQNYIEIELMPRIDRAQKPIRLTIQWADGLSPARKAAKLQGELEELRKELDAIRFAAHMPEDYEFGLPSWINQRLYLSYIGGYFSAEVMEQINTGRLTFADSPVCRQRDEALRVLILLHKAARMAREWFGPEWLSDGDDRGGGFCPVCGHLMEQGHATNCHRQPLLAALDAALEATQ